MVNNKDLYNFQNTAFTIFIVVSYILYALILFGFLSKAPEYTSTLIGYIKIYICLFLIWRFNPLRYNIVFTELDRKIVFSAGLFLLTTTAISQLAIEYANNLTTKAIDRIKNIIYF